MKFFCSVEIFTGARKHTKDLPCRKEDGLQICRIKTQSTTLELCVTRAFASFNEKRCGYHSLNPSDFDVPCLM